MGLGVVFTLSVLSIQGAEKKAKVDTSKLPPPSDQKGVTYEKDIKPISNKSCIKCNGTIKPKTTRGTDSLAAVLKGGQDGKVVEPGNSADSMPAHNVAHIGDEDDYMPPPDNKDKIPPLTKAQIGLIRAWIDQGAK